MYFTQHLNLQLCHPASILQLKRKTIPARPVASAAPSPQKPLGGLRARSPRALSCASSRLSEQGRGRRGEEGAAFLTWNGKVAQLEICAHNVDLAGTPRREKSNCSFSPGWRAPLTGRVKSGAKCNMMSWNEEVVGVSMISHRLHLAVEAAEVEREIL